MTKIERLVEEFKDEYLKEYEDMDEEQDVEIMLHDVDNYYDEEEDY